MSASEPVPITRCLVNTITLSVEMSQTGYAVTHGVTDLNYPDESYPRTFVCTSSTDAIPAGDFIGSSSVFARANAYIDKFTRKTVPPHHDKADSTEGVSHLSATARVETADTTYKLQFNTTVPPSDPLPFQLADIIPDDGEKQECVGIDAIPGHIVKRGEAIVDETIDR